MRGNSRRVTFRAQSTSSSDKSSRPVRTYRAIGRSCCTAIAARCPRRRVSRCAWPVWTTSAFCRAGFRNGRKRGASRPTSVRLSAQRSRQRAKIRVLDRPDPPEAQGHCTVHLPSIHVGGETHDSTESTVFASHALHAALVAPRNGGRGAADRSARLKASPKARPSSTSISETRQRWW
jgi:hypothetical protein